MLPPQCWGRWGHNGGRTEEEEKTKPVKETKLMAERSHGWWTRKDRGEIYTTREDVCPAMREGLCEHPWPSDRCDRSVGRPPELASTRSLSGRAAAMLTAEPPPTPMSLPSKATPWSFARLYRPLHRVSSLVEAATKPVAIYGETAAPAFLHPVARSSPPFES